MERKEKTTAEGYAFQGGHQRVSSNNGSPALPPSGRGRSSMLGEEYMNSGSSSKRKKELKQDSPIYGGDRMKNKQYNISVGRNSKLIQSTAKPMTLEQNQSDLPITKTSCISPAYHHNHHHYRNRGDDESPLQLKLLKKKKKEKQDMKVRERSLSRMRSASCNTTLSTDFQTDQFCSTECELQERQGNHSHRKTAEGVTSYPLEINETSSVFVVSKRKGVHKHDEVHDRNVQMLNDTVGCHENYEKQIPVRRKNGKLTQDARRYGCNHHDESVRRESHTPRQKEDTDSFFYSPLSISHLEQEQRIQKTEAEGNDCHEHLNTNTNGVKKNFPSCLSSSLKMRLLRCDTAPIGHVIQCENVGVMNSVNVNSAKYNLPSENDGEADGSSEYTFHSNPDCRLKNALNLAEDERPDTSPFNKNSEQLSCSIISLSNTLSGRWNEGAKPSVSAVVGMQKANARGLNVPVLNIIPNSNGSADDNTDNTTDNTTDNNNNNNNNNNNKTNDKANDDMFRNTSSSVFEDKISATTSRKRCGSATLFSHVRPLVGILADADNSDGKRFKKALATEEPNDFPNELQHRRDRVLFFLGRESNAREVVKSEEEVNSTSNHIVWTGNIDSVQSDSISSEIRKVERSEDLREAVVSLHVQRQFSATYGNGHVDGPGEGKELPLFSPFLPDSNSLSAKQDTQESVVHTLNSSAPDVFLMESAGMVLQPTQLSFTPTQSISFSRVNRSDVQKNCLKLVKGHSEHTFDSSEGTTPPFFLAPPPPNSFSVLSNEVTPTLLDDKDMIGFGTLNSRASCIRSFRLSEYDVDVDLDDIRELPKGLGNGEKQDGEGETKRKRVKKSRMEMGKQSMEIDELEQNMDGRRSRLQAVQNPELGQMRGSGSLRITLLRQRDEESPCRSFSPAVISCAGNRKPEKISSSHKRIPARTSGVAASIDSNWSRADQCSAEILNDCNGRSSLSLSSATLVTSLRKASPGGSLRRLRDTDPLLQDSGRRSKRKERGRSEMAEMKSFVSFDRKDKVEKKLNRSHRTKNSLVMLHSESASSQSPRHHRYHWKNGPAAVEHVKEDHDGQDNDPSVPNVLTEVQETGTTCTLTSAACPLLPSFTAFDGIETLRNSAENDNIPGKQPRAVKKCREGTFFTGIVSNKSRRNSLEVQVPGDHLGNLADVGFWPLSPVSISVTGVNSLQWSEYSWYKKCPAPSLV